MPRLSLTRPGSKGSCGMFSAPPPPPAGLLRPWMWGDVGVGAPERPPARLEQNFFQCHLPLWAQVLEDMVIKDGLELP